MKKQIGIIGWRGVVGSVLCDRMTHNNDWQNIDAHFFSTSNAGGAAPEHAASDTLLDAYNLDCLAQMDILVSCQGSDYTQKVYSSLRSLPWHGYWLDAASHLRMHDDSAIVLDPVNGLDIERYLNDGIKTFVGGNCTVSLMLMSISSLMKEGWVEWVNSNTYQAASGAGAAYVRELLQQMNIVSQDIATSVIDIDRNIQQHFSDSQFPMENFGHPLACNLLPWIDIEAGSGQSREEKKAIDETNKILRLDNKVPVDGICVRVASVRCHAQSLTIKLKKNISLEEITSHIANAHQWSSVIPNTKEASLHCLTPAKVSGTLSIPTGRIRKLNFGEEYLSLFTVGDQLLWGAAEPIRRMLTMYLL